MSCTESSSNYSRARTGPGTLRMARVGAVACWAAFLAILALLYGEDRAGVLHPAATPLLLLLALLTASTALTLGMALSRRLPRRHRDVGGRAAFLAVLPVALLVAGGERARAGWAQRSVEDTPLLRMAQCAGAALMEAEASVRYPHEMRSERLVMRYDRLATPDRDFREMDAHVARLERLLGRPLRSPIHWFRGPLLGQSGVSYLGLALGSAESPPDWSGRQTDRHELAHAVLRQMIPPDASPPTALSEGWAESQSGAGSADLAAGAARCRSTGNDPALLTLLGPEWYYRDRGAVYDEGGALVDYLLRHFGAARFLRLYTEIRPGRVEPAIRDALGVEPDTLERGWREDVARQSPAVVPSRDGRLHPAALRPVRLDPDGPGLWRTPGKGSEMVARPLAPPARVVSQIRSGPPASRGQHPLPAGTWPPMDGASATQPPQGDGHRMAPGGRGFSGGLTREAARPSFQ